MKHRSTKALCFVLSLFGYASGYSAPAVSRPNIIIRTPNIDRLAREGMRFTEAYSTGSVCSPTRYAVITGRYCWRSSLSSGEVVTSDNGGVMGKPGSAAQQAAAAGLKINGSVRGGKHDVWEGGFRVPMIA